MKIKYQYDLRGAGQMKSTGEMSLVGPCQNQIKLNSILSCEACLIGDD